MRRVNEYGFIETPYRECSSSWQPTMSDLVGRTLREDVIDAKTAKMIAEDRRRSSMRSWRKKLAKTGVEVPVMPFVSDEIDYLSADAEDNYVIAQANAPLDERSEFVSDRVSRAATTQKFLFVAARPDRLHGRCAAPDRGHQRRADPVPGAR